MHHPRLRLCSSIFVALALGVACGDDDSTTVGSDTADGAPTATTTPTIGAATLPDKADPLAPNAEVERVVDGDTIVVDIEGQRERVRLLGIDTPESVAENRPDQCFGDESSAHLASLLPPGTEITLIRDVEARDQYDRLLAYVVRSEDQLFVNLHLVESGYAGTLIYEPNDHYADVLEDAERVAARDGVGLWSVCGGPDVPLE